MQVETSIEKFRCYEMCKIFDLVQGSNKVHFVYASSKLTKHTFKDDNSVITNKVCIENFLL